MIIAKYYKYNLDFISPSGTSRGVLRSKPTWFLKIFNEEKPEIFGLGECSPIDGLSIEPINEIERKLKEVVLNINDIKKVDLNSFPCVNFGIETAFSDLKNMGERIIFHNDFSKGKSSIRINGLIWMGTSSFMINQIKDKIEQGFKCLKIKIGAINFEQEIEILKSIRKVFSSSDLEIRVDANGSFDFKTALIKLEKLSEFKVHSIEQPIEVDQLEEMRKLCLSTPIPIALDEELIKLRSDREKNELISFIKPKYIILKPSLLGGIEKTKKWISISEKNNIEWWITSALESNIGLNALAQFCGQFKLRLPQGLGTGSLYKNNIHSPLTLNGEKLSYVKSKSWDLTKFN
jgi:o-succinylbenzoate synthase